MRDEGWVTRSLGLTRSLATPRPGEQSVDLGTSVEMTKAQKEQQEKAMTQGPKAVLRPRRSTRMSYVQAVDSTAMFCCLCGTASDPNDPSNRPNRALTAREIGNRNKVVLEVSSTEPNMHPKWRQRRCQRRWQRRQRRRQQQQS